MKCIAKKKLSAFLDGEVSEKEKAAIDEHLKRCADCRNQAEDLAFVSDTLDLLEGAEPVPCFALRLRKRIAPKEPKGFAKWAGRIAIPAGAALASALLFLSGIYLGKTVYGRWGRELSKPVSSISGIEFLNDFHQGSFDYIITDTDILDKGGS